ncbi:MAG: AAA family ATPase, partial [Clostridiales bacterium]|nr:AAA family ATPase [Clostridiales bacterium]
MKKKYLPRIADKALELYLECSGAVLIEGLKWCGKSRTAEEKAKSAIYLQDPDNRERYERTIGIKPSLLLEGETPRLIDEWQDFPSLWDAVRFAVDRRGDVGQFILTGSAVPKDNATKHTGTGRINRFTMRTMSLFESKESNGKISLKALFDGIDDIEGISTVTIESLAFILARGGWPASIGVGEAIALQNVYNYCEAVINQDINRVDGVDKNPQRVRALMKSYARHISTMATAATITADVFANDSTISDKTMSVYLNALERI